MAEPSPVGDPIEPHFDRGAAARALAAIPARDDQPIEGQPIEDVPPLVELVEFIQPPTQRSPAGSQRPVRRNFLAPVSREISGPPPLPHLRPRSIPRPEFPRLPPPSAADMTTAADSHPALPTPEAESGPVAAQRPRWRRLAGVATGVTIALGLAISVQLGADLKTLGRLQHWAALQFGGSLPAAHPGDPPADAAGRVAHYAARAEAGDASAQLALGVIYAKGEGVEQDYATAAKWFRAAADGGVSRAQYDLGVLYERGRGVPLDYPQAVAWYRKAAEQNHPMAQYNLAVAFTKGQGVRRDFFEAAVWYHRAAAQGVVAAMINLAILYERGEGLESSPVDAYAWYRAAARRGSQPAAKRAEELLQAFSPVEQSRAEAKTLDINASIRDPVGERARLAAKSAQSTPVTSDSGAGDSGSPQPLKSGIERRPTLPGSGGTRPETP